MRLWNMAAEDISRLYNNQTIIIKSGSIADYNDDLAVFLLGNKEVRGKGLVQLKEDDKKEDRYLQGRENIYQWNREIYDNYERHCEERESQRLQPLKPHEPIIKAKKIIDEYEKWQNEGKPIPKEIGKVERTLTAIYLCPICNEEFSTKELYFAHFSTHQKEEVSVNDISSNSTSSGKG